MLVFNVFNVLGLKVWFLWYAFDNLCYSNLLRKFFECTKTLIHLVINLLRRFAKNKEVCFDRWDSGDLKTFPCILNSITVKFHFMQI